MTIYTLDFFKDAETIELDESLLETFQKLNRLFNKKMLNKQKVFKKTSIVVDNLSAIKTIINKMTLETFTENCETLINEYKAFSDKKMCSAKIFDILSKNIFYSSLYASLYSELIKIDENFLITLDEYKPKLREQYSGIIYFDPESDYDNFCKNNLVNESIKSTTSFYCYLLLNGNIDSEYIIENIEFLIDKIKSTKDNIIVFELIENINIYITITYNILRSNQKWKTIIESIDNMKDKRNEFSHLKNKCVFKCMDIIDFVNKI